MEYLFQLANKLSFAGIKVSFYKGSASVLKTINMSAKYADDELKNSKSIMSDATMVVRQKSTIDSKKLQRVANTVTSIADNFQNNNLGLAIKRCLNNNIIFVAPENICVKTYAFLYKSFEIPKTHIFFEHLNALLNCTVSDTKTQSDLITKMSDIVATIANDLFLTLTLEKNAMDAYYLYPYIAGQKSAKALKGIYKTSVQKEIEMQTDVAKIDSYIIDLPF